MGSDSRVAKESWAVGRPQILPHKNVRLAMHSTALTYSRAFSEPDVNADESTATSQLPYYYLNKGVFYLLLQDLRSPSFADKLRLKSASDTFVGFVDRSYKSFRRFGGETAFWKKKSNSIHVGYPTQSFIVFLQLIRALHKIWSAS